MGWSGCDSVVYARCWFSCPGLKSSTSAPEATFQDLINGFHHPLRHFVMTWLADPVVPDRVIEVACMSPRPDDQSAPCKPTTISRNESICREPGRDLEQCLEFPTVLVSNAHAMVRSRRQSSLFPGAFHYYYLQLLTPGLATDVGNAQIRNEECNAMPLYGKSLKRTNL